MFWIAVATVVCSVTSIIIIMLRERHDALRSVAERQRIVEQARSRLSGHNFLWSVAHEVTLGLVAHEQPGAASLYEQLICFHNSLRLLEQELNNVLAGRGPERLQALVEDAYEQQHKYDEMQRSLLMVRPHMPRAQAQSFMDLERIIGVEPIRPPDESGQARRSGARATGNEASANAAA